MTRTYECAYCGYIGPCPQMHFENKIIDQFSNPLCKRCGRYDKLQHVIIEKTCMLRKNCPTPYEQNGPNCSPMTCDGWIGL